MCTPDFCKTTSEMHVLLAAAIFKSSTSAKTLAASKSIWLLSGQNLHASNDQLLDCQDLTCISRHANFFERGPSGPKKRCHLPSRLSAVTASFCSHTRLRLFHFKHIHREARSPTANILGLIYRGKTYMDKAWQFSPVKKRMVVILRLSPSVFHLGIYLSSGRNLIVSRTFEVCDARIRVVQDIMTPIFPFDAYPVLQCPPALQLVQNTRLFAPALLNTYTVIVCTGMNVPNPYTLCTAHALELNVWGTLWMLM